MIDHMGVKHIRDRSTREQSVGKIVSFDIVYVDSSIIIKSP